MPQGPVDAEEYSGFPVFQELLKVKPEYGSSRRIEVKLRDGNNGLLE